MNAQYPGVFGKKTGGATKVDVPEIDKMFTRLKDLKSITSINPCSGHYHINYAPKRHKKYI